MVMYRNFKENSNVVYEFKQVATLNDLVKLACDLISFKPSGKISY